MTLAEYLVTHSNTFKDASLVLSTHRSGIFLNGTLTGLIGSINRSEVDIAVQPLPMNELSTKVVDFVYPYELYSGTFMTKKPDYKPQMFGILQTFSLPLWIAIISIIIAMSLIYYAAWKHKYSFDKIMLHVFAVFFRQSSILRTLSLSEKLLIYSWVVGAMIICLAYDSVFLSFLAIPSVNTIKDVSQLTTAVEKEQYHCIAEPISGIYSELISSEQKNLKVIGSDILKNNLSSNESAFTDFFHDRSKVNLALIIETEIVDSLKVGKKFVSEDRFLESMAATLISKNFCCKNLIEMFVHRLMASGLYFKYFNHANFLKRLSFLLGYQGEENSSRKLILTDVAPAFIFLLTGYFISFFVLIGEILLDRKKRVN